MEKLRIRNDSYPIIIFEFVLKTTFLEHTSILEAFTEVVAKHDSKPEIMPDMYIYSYIYIYK
jgi:hypothetical protein